MKNNQNERNVKEKRDSKDVVLENLQKRIEILKKELEKKNQKIDYLEEELRKVNESYRYIVEDLLGYWKDNYEIRLKSIEKNLKVLSMELYKQQIGKKLKKKFKDGKIDLPVKDLLTIRKNCKDLDKKLEERIKGQSEALGILKRAINSHFSLLREERPTVFMFIGPTGVGKTYTAKVLNDILFEGVSKKPILLRINCGEYQKEHEVSKLIGAPPGYIGHEEDGVLPKHIKEFPHFSIVLFDEIEKAHPRIWDFLLAPMDEGYIMGNKEGEIYYCKHYIFIFTGNIGEKEAAVIKSPIGFGVDEEKAFLEKRKEVINEVVRKTFPPEFLNRLREVIEFKYLNKNVAREILEVELKDLRKRAKKYYNIDIILTNSAKDRIIEEGYSRRFGARELKRTLEKYTSENEEFLDKLLIPIYDFFDKTADLMDGINRNENELIVDYKGGKFLYQIRQKNGKRGRN